MWPMSKTLSKCGHPRPGLFSSLEGVLVDQGMSIYVCFVHCLDLRILYFKCSTRLSMGSFFSIEAICGIARPPSLLGTTTRLCILCFVFYTLQFVICISNAQPAQVNSRKKSSITTFWPLTIIYNLQKKNILRQNNIASHLKDFSPRISFPRKSPTNKFSLLHQLT